MKKMFQVVTLSAISIGFLSGCVIKPLIYVSSVDIEKESTSLHVGEEEILSVSISPSDATNKELTWSSDSPSVVSVDNNGKLSALSVGSAEVSATAKDGSGKFDVCSVTVTAAIKKVTSISFNKESLDMHVGDQETLTASVLPEDATNKELTWSSDNTNVAVVDQSGQIIAKTIGNASITATAKDGSGVSKSINVSVSKNIIYVDSVTLDKENISLLVGESSSLSATVLPDTADNKELDWTVENTSVATFNNGTVTPIAEGTTTITATAKDGSGKSDSCLIDVNKYQTIIGSFTESEGKIISSAANSGALFYKNTNTNGYTISSNMLSNTDNKSGIIFNAAKDLSNFYLLCMTYDFGNQMKLMKYDSINGYTLLKGCYVTAGYSKTANVNLKVIVNSSTIRCLFSDKEIICVENSKGLENPYVGIFTESASSQFDNFVMNSTYEGEKADTLIAGHSYAELWTNYKTDLADLSDDIVNIGIGGTASTDWINHVDEIVDYQPNKLIFMMGINDIPRSTSVTDIASNIGSTLDQVIGKLPNIKICLVSTNRCIAVNSDENVEKIRALNIEMKKYVSNHLDNVVYGNMDNAFLDDNANVIADAFTDGLHPTASSYQYIAAVIKDAFTHFETRAKDTKKTVIIGHSYMDNWKQTCKTDLDLYKDITNIGVGGSTSEGWLYKTSEIIALNPDRLIYMIGINDIHHKINNGSLYENMKKVLTTVKTSCPNMEAVVLSVNQVPLDYDKFSLEIADANTFITRLSVEYEWIHYGNLENAFLNAQGKPNQKLFMEGDFGLHPNMENYDVIAKAIYDGFDGKSQPTTYSTSGLELVTNIESNSLPSDWSRTNDTIVSNANGFALSKDTYSDFMTTITLDGVYEGPDGDDFDHNPWFSHILTKGIIVGGSVTQSGNLKGYIVSLTKNWIQVGYLDGNGIDGNPYKCSGILEAHNFDPNNIALTIRVNCGVLYVQKPNGEQVISHNMTNYEKGSIGTFGNDNVNFKTTFLEFNNFSSYSNSIANSIDSTTLPANWSVVDNTVISNANGFALSKNTYNDVTLMINMKGVYEGPDGDDFDHNPFFSHEVTKGIVIGGSVAENGNLKGYVISLTKNWVHICYLDGIGENENPYKISGTLFSYNFDPNGVSFIVKISGKTIQLYKCDGTTLYKETFESKSSYQMDKYTGGSIGVFATDGQNFSTSFLNLNKWPISSKEVFK